MRFLKALQIVVAVGILLGLVHALIYLLVDPGDRLHGFIYDRSFVQHATLLVTCLVIVLLFARASQHRWNHARFTALVQKRGGPPKELADQLNAISETCNRHGMAAATAHAEQAAQHHTESIRKAHETIGFLAGSLPALGMFGTMLGLSNSLFEAFAGGSQGSAPVEAFVTALSTAMDTTVLAMACAVPLFGCVWLLGRLENELSDRYAEYVRVTLGLDQFAAHDKTAHALQAELRRMMAEVGKDAKAAFGQIVADSGDVYRENLERAVAEVFSRQRRHDKDMVRKLAAELADGMGQSVNRVGDLIERQNGNLAEGMIHQVGRLEETLRNRTPEEVLIRYPHNGHKNKE